YAISLADSLVAYKLALEQPDLDWYLYCEQQVKHWSERKNIDFNGLNSLGKDLYDFILDRLRGYYADKGVPVQHFNAVAELRPASLYDFDRRIDAIGTFAQLPEAEALAAANKRINNILKKAGDDVPATV